MGSIIIFKDYRDFSFIEFGNNGNQEIISRLEQVVEQCPDTLFSKWASARLGLEYFNKFKEKYISLDAFKEQYLDKGIEAPLFEKGIHYFTIGAKLSDEFPIRENLLWEFGEIEYAGGNYTKALAIAEELSTKYPSGEYGKRAEKEKIRMESLVDSEVSQKTQTKATKPIGVALPIAGATVAVIAIAGLILFSRKKKQEK